MSQHEIVALRCPSCGSGITEPSRDMPFGAEFRCEVCNISSVLIIDQSLVPVSTLQKLGEKVCILCGRMAPRDARFCQEGHELVRQCHCCGKDVAVDHQRCDYCGNLKDALQLHGIYRGTVSRIVDFGAFVEILPGVDALLHISEIADQRISDVRDVLKEGEQIDLKVIKIDGTKINVSMRALNSDSVA